MSYNNAKLRYAVSYTIGEGTTTRGVYSNEVTVSILKQLGTVSVTVNDGMLKIYYGEPVTVDDTANSQGQRTIEYYQKILDCTYNILLEEVPSAVGEYKVKFTVTEDESYFEGTAEKEFTILYLKASADDNTITAAEGVKETDGWFNGNVINKPIQDNWTLVTELNCTYDNSITVSDY